MLCPVLSRQTTPLPVGWGAPFFVFKGIGAREKKLLSGENLRLIVFERTDKANTYRAKRVYPFL